MRRGDWGDKLEHDLTSAICNFKVAADLLEAPIPNRGLVVELLRASVEQLEALRKTLISQGLGFVDDKSTVARK